LFFERVVVNFKGMREKRERKKKNSIATQLDLSREHALHSWKKNDWSLPNPSQMKDFSNRMALHTPPKRHEDCHEHTSFFLIIFNYLKLLNNYKNEKTKMSLQLALVFLIQG